MSAASVALTRLIEGVDSSHAIIRQVVRLHQAEQAARMVEYARQDRRDPLLPDRQPCAGPATPADRRAGTAGRWGGWLAGAAAIAVLASACGSHTQLASTPVLRHIFGTLSGDAGSGCVWLADPTGKLVAEIRLPPKVQVAFTPAVTLTSGGRTLRAGQPITAEDLGSGPGRPHCPLAQGHLTRLVGPPLWGGTVRVQASPKRA